MYHDEFRPSRWLKSPKAALGCPIICADTDQEAEELALSTELSFSLIVQGKCNNLPSVSEACAYPNMKKDW